jgi:hypothetical protein
MSENQFFNIISRFCFMSVLILNDFVTKKLKDGWKCRVI